MAQIQYTTVPGKIKPLLSKIHEVGIPPRATSQWLKSIGFTSSNDQSLIGVLKLIGFCDGSGVPTEFWKQYRGAKHRDVLSSALRKGYSELFAVYPDAWNRQPQDIEHVFSTSSTAGKQAIGKAVATFNALAELADFQNTTASLGTADLQIDSGTMHTPIASGRPKLQQTMPESGAPSVHIDIQIHIAPEANSDQIDQIFASMAKHLYKK
jgi:hypothetical protein